MYVFLFGEIKHISRTILTFALADLGGVLGARPLRDPILSFLHTVLPKSAHIGGPRPPNGSTPPLREIPDPPLLRKVRIKIYHLKGQSI